MNAAGNSEPAPQVTNAASGAEPTTPGELLRRERERRSISQLQAAEELHLDVRVVEAIETNRFDLLGVPVYARGHLRKYASLVGLSPEMIIQRYEALTDRPQIPTPVPTSVNAAAAIGFERRRSFKGPVLVSLGLIALATIGYLLVEYWPTLMNGAASLSQISQPAADVTPNEFEVSEMDRMTPSAPPAQAAPETSAAEPAATAVASVADVRVRLEYTDESWTEIYDATG